MVELVVKMLVVGVALVVTTCWVIGSNMLIIILRLRLWGLATSISARGASRLDNTARKNSIGIGSVTENYDTASKYRVCSIEVNGAAPVVVCCTTSLACSHGLSSPSCCCKFVSGCSASASQVTICVNLNCVQVTAYIVFTCGQIRELAGNPNVIHEVAYSRGIELNPSPGAGILFFVKEHVSTQVF